MPKLAMQLGSSGALADTSVCTMVLANAGKGCQTGREGDAAMMRAAVLAVMLAVGASGAWAQGADSQLHTASPTELGCIKVLLAQERAWNLGDLQAFVKAYKDSPDIVFLSNSVSKGYAGMLDTYRHNYPNRASMGTLTFSDLEVKPLDERFAVVLGHYKLERGKKEGGNAEGVFSLVMEKTTDGWKIVVDHTT